MRAKIYFILEVTLLYFFPLLVMGQNPTLLSLRPYFFGLGGIYIVLQALRAKVKPLAWGLTTKGVLPTSLKLLPLTLSLPFIAYALLSIVPPATQGWLIGYDMLDYPLLPRLILYVFASVPIQELIFRSYLVWRLERLLLTPAVIIPLSTLLFFIGHLPFHSPLMLLVSLVMGYVYARSYQQSRLLFPLIFSHALAGSLLLLVRNHFLPY